MAKEAGMSAKELREKYMEFRKLWVEKISAEIPKLMKEKAKISGELEAIKEKEIEPREARLAEIEGLIAEVPAEALPEELRPAVPERAVAAPGAKASVAWEWLARKGVGAEFKVKDVGTAAGYSGGAATAFCDREAARHNLEKVGPGKYRVVRIRGS